MLERKDLKEKIITRKIQKTGGSSFVITLPKDWLYTVIKVSDDEIKGKDDTEIKKIKDKKLDDEGMELGVIVQPDNTLTISPSLKKETLQRKKTIELDPAINPSYLFRYLVSTYINGFTSIEITSQEHIPPTLRLAINRFIQMVIGLEVVDEKEEYLHIKDLLNPAEMPFENIIKRMHVTAKGMHQGAIEALKKADANMAKETCQRDDDIDRLYWLVARQTNMLLRDVNLEEKMGTPADLAANMFLISRIMERIGDHAVRIAENVINMQGQRMNAEITEKLELACETALGTFDKSIEALIEGDMVKANDNIESVKELETQCEEIIPLARKQEAEIAILVDNIIESIRRIGEYAEDISENVMNILAWRNEDF